MIFLILSYKILHMDTNFLISNLSYIYIFILIGRGNYFLHKLDKSAPKWDMFMYYIIKLTWITFDVIFIIFFN